MNPWTKSRPAASSRGVVVVRGLHELLLLGVSDNVLVLELCTECLISLEGLELAVLKSGQTTLSRGNGFELSCFLLLGSGSGGVSKSNSGGFSPLVLSLLSVFLSVGLLDGATL